MKRVFTIAVFLLMAVGVFGLTWLDVELYAELGWMPNGVFRMYTSDEIEDMAGDFYVDFGTEFIFLDHLGVGGNVKTFVSPYLGVGPGNWWPHKARYGVYVRAWWDWIEIGFRHTCIHPVIPNMKDLENFEQLWEGSYEEVYARFSLNLGED